MSTLTHDAPVIYLTQDVTYLRSRKAARIAARIEEQGISDAREITERTWDALAARPGKPARRSDSISHPTRAAITAILDVRHGRTDARIHGDGEDHIAYNTNRLAARAAEVLIEADVTQIDQIGDREWRMAVRILRSEPHSIKADALSDRTKRAVAALIDAHAAA